MKRTLLPIAILLLYVSLCPGAGIAGWTFELPNMPPTVTGPTMSGLMSDFGGGMLSGVHASASTVFGSAEGNGSTYALTADSWQTGDYWQLQVSTLGFKQIAFSLDITASYSGPTNMTLAYSVDGSTFVTINPNVPVMAGGVWNGVYNPVYHMAFDLSSETALDNASAVYLRLIANVPPFAMGDQTLDNISFSGTVIPEPASHLLLGTAGLALGLWVVRKRVTGRFCR